VINKGYALIAFISEVDISPLSNSISDESRIPLHCDLAAKTWTINILLAYQRIKCWIIISEV